MDVVWESGSGMIPGITASILQAAAAAGGITFVSPTDTAVQGANTLAVTPALPIAHQADDLAILFARSDQDTTTLLTGTGWTKLRQDAESLGRDMTSAIFYKKLTDSDTDGYVDTTVAEEHSASVIVFRGVDTTNPFDVTEVYEHTAGSGNPTSPAITTVTNNCCIVLLYGPNQYYLTAAGAPTGYTLASEIINEIQNEQAVAYRLDAGTLGEKVLTPWLNTVSSESAVAVQCYTLALRPA